MANKIKLSKSSIGIEEREAVLQVLENEYLGMGSDVKLFEDEIKAFLKTEKSVICVNTGTAALHLALQAIGIKTGDEVLVPSLTYIASFQAVSATGAKPIACDVNENTLFIDINDTEKRIRSHTKAVMPVHYASNSAGIDEVYKLANKYNLRVIEDAAHAFGCKRGEKYTGVDGDIICFSFDGIKNITSGEGGVIVTSDKKIINYVKDARLLGVKKDTDKRYSGERSWDFDVNQQGWRYHMSNIMAAIGREQLKKIDKFKIKRQKIAKRYLDGLKALRYIDFLDLDYYNIMLHIFVIKVTNGKRDALRNHLLSHNIECGIHYKPNHLLTKYKTLYSLSISEKVYNEILSLPCHVDLTENDQTKVIQIIKDFFDE